MDNLNIVLSLRLLLDEYSELTPILSKYLFEQTWTRDGRQELLNDLSELLLQEKYTVRIAMLFTPILLELLNRTSDMTSENSTAKHEWLCICLSKLVWNFPEVGRFTRLYFEKSYNLFCRFEEDSEPAPKKQKTEIMHASPYQLLKAAYLFLIYDTPYFKDLWDWSVLVNFLYGELEESWYAYQCLARIGNIKSGKLISIFRKRRNENSKEDFVQFAEEDIVQFAEEEIALASYWNYDLYSPFREDILQSGNILKLSDSDLSPEVVNVCGILLNRYTDNEVLGVERLVCVPSVLKSLHSLALAVSSGEPVLLQGPVGCGKTSLVEYLASLTGRKPFEDLLKIQLGDHMDSKTLLGTYCCTDVPGEFIWKSGVLVQAMIEGHWLLLEDIDCAPMDVVSLLVPVLQSRTIVLPGPAHPIKAASGFQLFATQRLLSGFGGSYLEFRNNAEIINKQWRKIMIDPFPKQELEKVIATKWPILEPIIDRILEVYSIFSSDITNDHRANNEAFNAYSRHGRLISTRDLFKFCNRITEGFDVTSVETSISVFQNAVECFCDHIPCPKTQLSAAESVGVKFNIPRAKAEYFCKKSKPEIEKSADHVKIGRVYLERKTKDIKTIEIGRKFSFAHTRLASALLEKVAVAVSNDEPVLLVGETGTGKTSVVQHLADLTNNKLTVINMSQQSDSVDLLGGYKPVDLIQVIHPIREAFLELFPLVINADKNAKFLQHISNCYYKRKYEELLGLMLHAQKNIVDLFEKKYSSSAKHVMMISKWRTLGEKIQRIKQQMQQMKNALAFKFIEGALIKAMKNGEWLLLDEINLAEAETLECLAGILEKDDNTLLLLEKGNKEPIARHPDFHVFACMNPATDIGKKDLPAGIRSRFTEFFVQEIDDKIDLTILVQMYLRGLSLNPSVIENVVDFYTFIKKAATEKLNDGTGHHPHYSLRTLCRALKCASSNPCHNVPRSLYEAFCLSFLSQLDNESHPFVTSAIANHLLGKKHLSILKQSIPEPRSGKHVPIQGYWILKGSQGTSCSENYIFTNTVYRNLHDLARIVSAGRYPVLLQGETSVGKTSLVQWLAKATGNVCVRVNNHEHTDIQEYVGTYSADENGKLIFKEGILVEAMRNGYWIILDELNLAPTEVMEALNRVLDDNRELFIAETQTLVKAHSGFMIFATQNPPGLYGGRKLLSRAFRNRFIELHFNEIPPSELEIILEKRCKIPLSYSKKLVAVMQELQVRRRESGVFAGKQGYITLRDLFRWGERYAYASKQTGTFYDWEQHLADEGYLLLGGRVRLDEELKVIKEVIEKHLKRTVNTKLLFDLSEDTSLATKDILMKALETPLPEEFGNIVWTYSMRRLAVLVGKALEFKEPVLLVGNTGCGKTTMCQIYAEIFGRTLYSVNCHMHSESADFLGGLRPIRDVDERDSKLFEWVDGPLILAMQEGSYFLADEISLADDSVLERLNSVLEPEQTILLAEKCFDTCQESEIIAEKGFQFFATMNPGGDYGKKELSPALRNRFTEIWCPSNLQLTQDIIDIVEHNIKKGIYHPYATEKDSGFGVAVAEFLSFYTKTDIGRWTTVSVRDVLTWVEFINICEDNLLPSEAYLHGAFLVFLDAVGSGPTAIGSPETLQDVKRKCFDFLLSQVGKEALSAPELLLPELYLKAFEEYPIGPCGESESYFGIGPFVVDFDSSQYNEWCSTYVLDSRTPKLNALRILRAMQLSKPILLEGNPGVGKTSMISALAKASGHKLVRINLSEQTDISDLFGADLPVEDGEKGEFAWHDGPLLQALNQGDWILLDELNLASQSVLEGLNACLDHRNEIHIPELGQTFHVRKHVSRIFGCQNPHRQGGARKGLPRSFLNRFTQVYMKPMEPTDFEFISTHVFSSISPQLISAMIKFNHELHSEVNVKRLWGQDGYPWEFNLRDIFRWCEAMVVNQNESDYNLGEYVKLIYVDRMRSVADKIQVYKLFDSVMQRCGMDRNSLYETVRHLDLNVLDNCVQLGYSFLPRVGQNLSDAKMMSIAHRQLSGLESLMKCIEMKWMAILVGPSGSGKSTLVRLLADLTGNQLHVISVNSEMDTTELLGGFEQADMNRKIEFLIQQLEPVVQQAILFCIEATESDSGDYLRHILHKVDSLARTKQDLYSEQVARTTNYYQNKLRHLRDLIDTLLSVFSIKRSRMKRFLRNFKEEVAELFSKLNSSVGSIGGQFEWMDSVLVQAAEKGHWVLIDDANFCSPSVLDRLNALLEPNGFLTINEQGAIDGALRDIYPHENFRIILTMNPKNGEISRAMRNRGIEIYLEPVSSNLHEEKDLFDMVAFSQCQGLVHSEMIFYLYDIHRRLTDCSEYEDPSLSDFLSASALCVQLLQKHEDAHMCLSKVAELVYVKNNFNVTSRQVAVSVIQEMMEKLPRLTGDEGIPLTSLLPTSLDYRQNAFLASVRKQGLMIVYFFKHIKDCLKELKRRKDGIIWKPKFSPYPVPDIPPLESVEFEIRKFVCIMRIMFQSCSIEQYKFLDHWLDTKLEDFLKNTVSDDLHRILKSILKFKNVLSEQLRNPVSLSLAADVANILQKSKENNADFIEIKQSEISIDPRWNPNIYRKLIFHLKQISTDSDLIEYKLSTKSNRFLLILLLESLDYITYEVLSMERNAILSLIPTYLQAMHDALLGLLQDDSLSCTDEIFWEFHHVLYLYHACRHVCEASFKSTVDFQLMLFAIYFHKLMKWTIRLFEDQASIPSSLKDCCDKLESHLGNTPQRRFRSKFVKWFGHPPGFFSETAAQLYCNVEETFQLLNMTSRLNSPKTRIEHLHIIAANKHSWMEILTKAALSSMYGVHLDRSAFVHDLSSVKDIKLQICDAELVDIEEDDEIMELCKTPAKRSNISDAELISQIQILPLWDYIFLLYESEMLRQAGKEIEKHLTNSSLTVKTGVSEDVLYKIGSDILGLNPIHLTQLIGLQKYESKLTYPFCVINFLRHARDGFSSSGLKALYFQVPQNKAELTTWDMNYTSAKQAPLLVYICSSVFGKDSNSSLNCHASLGSYTDKIKQLKIAENILWKNFEKLSSTKSSFRHCTAAIIVSWFNSLISTMAIMKGEYPSDRLLTKEGFSDFLKRSDISSLYFTGANNVLLLAFENILELSEKVVKDGLQWQISKCFVLVGLLTYMLLIPRDVIDPAIKNEQKVMHLSTRLRDLHCERGVFAFVSHVANGQTLGTVPTHPYVSGLLKICRALENELSAAKEKLIFRSHTDKYAFKNLKEETEQYLTSIGKPEEIIQTFVNLEQAYSNISTDFNIASLTQSAENCVKNLQNFSEMFVKKFILYKDMTVPFVTGIEQVIFGIRMAVHCIQCKELSIQFPIKDVSISEFLVQFISYSSSNSSDPLHVASLLLDHGNINAFKYLLSLCASSVVNSERLLYKLLKSAILEIINEAKLRSDLKRNHFKDRLLALLLTGLSFLWNMWKTQEDEAKIKKKEEEALYVHKTRHHERELTEEEVMNKNVLNMFPSYEKDFAEFIKPDPKLKKTRKLDSVAESADLSFFTHDDMFEVWKLHAIAMGRLFPSEYENAHEDIKFIMKDNKDPDYTTSYLLRQEVVNSIVTAVGDRLDLSVETESVSGLILMCHTLQKIKETDGNRYYDIYHDPNPSKVINFRSVLENLSVSVEKLLKKFPENPVLVEIFKIVQRVLSFSVTDPVMKFVIGFELILEASQLWEQNACSEVSLRTEIDELTKTIIECRAMELSCWSRGLDCVIRKQYYNSSKWWFLMFPIFSSSLESSEKGETKMSVINLLQQCLEDSPLGEFPARLSILFTFLLQYRISNCKDLAEIVYNVYSYYIQFLPSINNHIAQLRKPIEKEMKDYVKIARWNDMNFYSVKQSVEKSHRCIIKHIKTFEDALKKPAKNFFTLPSKINESESSPWSLDIKPEDFMSSQTKLPKLVAERKETLFRKLPMYHKKAKKLSERVSNNFPVIDHINRLNDLCGNIIEALQSVTSDAVKTVLTRSREKKQTLLNIQTKRQMLSTLFKNLRVMGLSFRQGIIYQKRVKINEVFSIPAFDPLSLQVLEIDLKFKELLLKSSSETSHYFYKNIAQYAHLQKSMESPCKDLTLDMIHRIQGYSGHLMQFITLQRQKIVKISKDVDAVGCFLATLSAFNKEQQTSGVKKNLTVLPPQNVMLEWEGLLCNYLVQFIVSVGQFRALMECAPSSAEMSSDLSVISSPLSANPLPSIDKKDSIWSGISTAYDHCATDIRKQLVLLSDVLNATHVYGTWHQFSWVGACFTSMQSAARQIMSVVKEAEYNAENCFTKNLSSLYSKICQETKNVTKSCATIVQEAETSTSRTNNKQDRILSRLCQKLTKEVLLAFQDMVKLCLQNDDNNQAEDIDVVSENLFTVRISASIDEIERCLRIENIKQIVNKLKKHIGLFQNSIEDLRTIDDSLRLLINLTPFLNQYYHLLKVYMAVILGMHRTSNKFLSILLEIFNILATKGFCIPPELQEEAKKYGATKFEDIEGGGLGEGEGTKDVSGNIETEDQLEDAFKEGQEKEDSDQKSKEIKEEEEGIEMSNDFEGKTHNPDEQDEEIEESEDEEDLEKKMGDVDTSDAEKLDEKIWGSDSEDEDEEEDLKEESGSGGVTENKESELVAKDGEYKKDDYEKRKDKRAEEFCPDTEDEYKEDIPDPLIDTAPQQEPEGLDLPDNMEIKDDYKENEDLEETEEDTNMEDVKDGGDTENEDEDSSAENEQEEIEEGNGIPSDNVESKDDIEGCDSAEPVQENEKMEIAADDQRNDLLPTHTPTSEEAIASADHAKSSSHDPVQCKETPMEWESGAQDVKEQHREGQADSTVSQSEDFGHEGKKSSAAVRKTGDDQQNKSKLKQPDENRVVDDSSTDKNVKHKPIVEKQSLKNSLGPDPETSADMYEHVSKKEEGVAQAVDIATEEQAAARPVQDQSESASDNEEVIEISSGDDEDEHPRAQGDSVRSDQRKKPGEKGEIGERDEKMEITEGEVVKTLTVPRGLESTIHTQNDLWRHLSSVNQQGLRLKMEKDLDLFCHAGKEQTISSGQLWRNYEILVSSLAQELCEQLRLVLEPTKMSKLKGDYRTGKRLNMRKIIPYIASDFRKDKIWLRRTKPSKRQYQIMLAVDDSSSMADNHSKQLAFESLAVLGQSLSLLEAGEISVVSFGEKVELLLGFNEQFSSITGSRIIEQFSFSQKRTNYPQMLNYATDAFVQARSNSRFTAVSKEIAQLLIIISDGRGIYREGEKVMKNAVRRARDNNIFMVFIVLDSPSNEHSILDIKCPVFEADQLKEMKCYMENFPFPFYIILRDISSLPLVLGEALRQWFELVTSVER